MDRLWCRLVSWHAVRFDDASRTLCGRQATDEVVTNLPAGRSCESCLRIAARQNDRP